MVSSGNNRPQGGVALRYGQQVVPFRLSYEVHSFFYVVLHSAWQIGLGPERFRAGTGDVIIGARISIGSDGDQDFLFRGRTQLRACMHVWRQTYSNDDDYFAS